jgi:cephalosporin hydroxylase
MRYLPKRVNEVEMTQKISWGRRLEIKFALNRKDDSQEFAGVGLRKLPSDCLALMKLLHRCRPRVVVELGSAQGGSALMIASWAEPLGLEQIVSVDILDVPRPRHPLITFIVGDTASPEMARQVHDLVAGRPCSLILDSDHHAPHVLQELELYHDLVGPGQALIVEDTLVDVLNFRKFRAAGGPLRALNQFLPRHPDFVQAEGIEPYVTTNFFGYLIRK